MKTLPIILASAALAAAPMAAHAQSHSGHAAQAFRGSGTTHAQAAPAFGSRTAPAFRGGGGGRPVFRGGYGYRGYYPGYGYGYGAAAGLGFLAGEALADPYYYDYGGYPYAGCGRYVWDPRFGRYVWATDYC